MSKRHVCYRVRNLVSAMIFLGLSVTSFLPTNTETLNPVSVLPATTQDPALIPMPPHPDLLEQWKEHPEQVPAFFQTAKPVDLDQPTSQPSALQGTFKVLVLLVDFSDKPSQVAASYFDSLVFGTARPSVKHYYSEVSYGLLDITTVNLPSTTGWFRAPQPYGYYNPGNFGWGSYPNNTQRLVEDLVALVNPVINFSQYDNDGDGYVDALIVAHAGTGAEVTSNVNDIWSHKWQTVANPLVDGVRVSKYTMQAEYWPTSWAPLPNMTIGVYVHELAHAFGLPDLYDLDGSSAGIGSWSLMAGGTWNGALGIVLNGGSSPAHPDAWSRAKLGWSTPYNLTTNLLGTSIAPIEVSGNNTYRLWTNGAAGNQYFLVENRQPIGYDAALPGFGLLIWHIDDGKTNNDKESTNHNNWLSPTDHYWVALEQADGRLDLEYAQTWGDSGDPYPGASNNRHFTFTSLPNSSSYSNSADTLIRIQNIGYSANTSIMYADLMVRIPPLAVITTAASNVTSDSAAFNGSLTLGTASSANVSFQWGTTSGNLTQSTTPQTMNSTGNFSANLTGLSSNTTYYFRAKASSDNVTVYGVELSFAPLPPFRLKWGTLGSGNGQFDSPTGVAVDASGDVYVADTGNHRLQKFTSTGAFITKWGSLGVGDGQFDWPFDVAVDASGNVYVADYNNDRIQKFTSSGTFLAKWGTQGIGDGQFSNPRGVAVDASGNVYVADTYNSRIQKFTSAGVFITKWGSFGSGDSQFNTPSSLAVDASGSVYVADTYNNRIQKFTGSGGFITKWGSYGTGDGQFSYPEGVAVDAWGNVYVADTQNDRLQKFTSSGSFLAKWGSYGSGDGQFDTPSGVAVDAWGNIYVADYNNNRIQVFGAPLPPSVTTNAADNITTSSARLNGTLTSRGSYSSVNVSFQWGTSSGNYTFETTPVSMNTTDNFSANLTGLSANTTYYFKAKASSDNVTAYGSELSFTTLTLAPAPPFLLKWGTVGSGDGQFQSPMGVAVDTSGNIYVVERDNHRIQKFASDGSFITRWGIGGSDDGQFQSPQGMAVDASSNVYVADSGNHRLQKFTSTGAFITRWGTYGTGNGQFNGPVSVAVDASGSVYVGDTNNHRIQKFASDGSFITKWGDYGIGNGQFYLPYDIAVDASGNVYVADGWNRRIQKFTSSGGFITKWGSLGTGDGQFYLPYGIAVDASGNVYVTDSSNYRIQKFTSSGAFITRWGTSGSGDGQFNYPTGVTADAWGNVYAADQVNHRIQVFGSSLPPSVTTIAADNRTTTSARLNGTLTSRGTAATANASFAWGATSGNYTFETTPQTMNSTGNFSTVISSLSANTTYYFKAEAVGDNMTVYGSELSFTTQALVSIEIAPDNPGLLPGRTQQFTATGTYSDNTTANITASANWTSANTSVATINSAGLATALAAGSTTITATSSNISDNTTLTVTASVEVNSGERITLAVNESRGNIPLTIKGIPDSGNGSGVSGFTFNLNWNKDVINVDNITTPTIAGFSLVAGSPNNTTGSANITGNTSGSYLVGNITVANLGISAVGTAGNSTSINTTVTQLIDHNLNPISAVSINATVEIIDLMAETSITHGVSSNVTVLKVNIDRIKNPSDNSTANIPGGIGSYTATANASPASGITFVTVNGVSPFDSPSFNTTTGVFSVANVTSPIQPSNTTVAEVVPILTGNTTTNVTLTITFQTISAADQPGLNVPEETSNTITLLRGDADKNGVISVVDSLAIKQYLVGQLTLAQINPIDAASPKSDGAGGNKISVVDALAIEQFLVGQLNAYFE